MIGLILSAGAFIDDFFATEKQKDWMRRKLIVLYLWLGVGETEPLPRLEAHRIKFFSWYFLDDWITFVIILAIPLGGGMINKWSKEGFSIWVLVYPAAGVIFLVIIIYSFFFFRWFLYMTKPGILRVIPALLILLFAGAAGYEILISDLDRDYGDSGLLFFAYVCVELFLICLLSMLAVGGLSR